MLFVGYQNGYYTYGVISLLLDFLNGVHLQDLKNHTTVPMGLLKMALSVYNQTLVYYKSY